MRFEVIDIIINVGWFVGIIVLWYPTYRLLLRVVVGIGEIDTDDHVMAILMGGVISVFWPIIIGIAVVGGGLFGLSWLISWPVRQLLNSWQEGKS